MFSFLVMFLTLMVNLPYFIGNVLQDGVQDKFVLFGQNRLREHTKGCFRAALFQHGIRIGYI